VASSQEIDAFLAGVERRAFKQALFAIQDHHSALDVVQNAMLKLVERYHDKPVEEFAPLFQRILQNTIHDHFRRGKVRDFWVRLVSPLRDKDDDNTETLESLAAHAESTHQPNPERRLPPINTLPRSSKRSQNYRSVNARPFYCVTGRNLTLRRPPK
jgi:DNA-directed RNA polymerase specialized sigma24 family protein